MLLPAEFSSVQAWTTRAAMASSALAHHTRGSVSYTHLTLPTIYSV